MQNIAFINSYIFFFSPEKTILIEKGQKYTVLALIHAFLNELPYAIQI